MARGRRVKELVECDFPWGRGLDEEGAGFVGRDVWVAADLMGEGHGV